MSSESSFGWNSMDEDDERYYNKKIKKEHIESRSKMSPTKIKSENHSTDDDVIINGQSNEKSAQSVDSDENSEEDDSGDLKNVAMSVQKKQNINNSLETQKKPPKSSIQRSQKTTSNTTVSATNNNNVLQIFTEKNSELKLSKYECNSEISDEDDIWLLQCPHNVDINALMNVNILHNNKKKLKLGNSSFECVPDQGNIPKKLSLLIPPTKSNNDFKVTSMDIKGVFILREKLKNLHHADVSEEFISKVPFPENLKRRHPLFGVDYKSVIKLPVSVKEKLNNPNLRKKVSKKSQPSVPEENENLEIENIEKNKRKRRTSINLNDSNVSKKKLKKEKTDMWASETSIEKSLFELPNKTVKKEKKN